MSKLWANFYIITKSSQLATMFRFASWKTIYGQDLKKLQKMKLEFTINFLKQKFQQQDINNILNFNMN
jgi:hypothetical protein